MNELVTICIPVYNGERTIRETILSLIDQTYKNIKIKVFDNCSSDSTVSILKSIRFETGHDFEIFLNENTVSAEENFSRCIHGGEGNYTAILHSDDVYMNNYVETLVVYLSENIDCVAVSTNAFFIDDNSEIIGERKNINALTPGLSYKFDFKELLNLSLSFGNFIMCPSVMVRTEVYQKNIKHWNGSDFGTAGDFDVWLRLSLAGKFALINKPLFKYRYSIDSYTYRQEALSNRVERQDFFKVGDYYINNYGSMLSKKTLIHYNILDYKDEVKININLMLNKKIDCIFFSKRSFVMSNKFIGLTLLKYFVNFLVVTGLYVPFTPFIRSLKKVNRSIC